MRTSSCRGATKAPSCEPSGRKALQHENAVNDALHLLFGRLVRHIVQQKRSAIAAVKELFETEKLAAESQAVFGKQA